MNAVPPTPKSNESIVFIQNQIRKCLNDHVACSGFSQDHTLPTRLLDLGDDIRLVESSSLDTSFQIRYVALSHCWGGSQPTVTIKQTLEARKQGIALSSLTRTFQDAVWVARQLGINCLWIDSICIIQDDRDDWRKESVMMCQVYKNAIFTISAASSPDSRQGFLNNYHSDLVRVVLFESQPADATEPPTRTEARRLPFHEISRPLHLRDPIETRAWTLQERELSCRLIEFTASEVIFTCRSMRNCECGMTSTAPGSQRGHRDFSATKLSSHHSHKDFSAWYDIVRQYGRRSLTKERDKLPALSGLATELAGYAPNIYQDYVAGLWSSRQDRVLFIHGLLWRLLFFTRQSPVPTNYRAPSFSWASVDEEISWGKRDADFVGRVTLLDRRVDLVRRDARFGEVSDGYLVLNGPLIRASFYVRINLLGEKGSMCDAWVFYRPAVHFPSRLLSICGRTARVGMCASI
jgi:hypothetical protein